MTAASEAIAFYDGFVDFSAWPLNSWSQLDTLWAQLELLEQRIAQLYRARYPDHVWN